MSRHLVSADSILDDSARMACKALSKSMLPQAFYLAGGTGLAIQLKHRISLDLDFFTIHPSERLDLTFVSSALERAVPRDKLSLVTSQIDQSTWTIGTTKVSFIAYPFSLLDEPLDGSLISGSSAGLQVATVRDIACMKGSLQGLRRSLLHIPVDRDLSGQPRAGLRAQIRAGRSESLLDQAVPGATRLHRRYPRSRRRAETLAKGGRND